MKEDNNIYKLIVIFFIIIFAIAGIKIFSKKASQNVYNEIANDYNELSESMSGIGYNLANPSELTEEEVVSNMKAFGEIWENSSLKQNMFSKIKQMLVVILIILVIYYICSAIGLQKIAKDEGYSSWQAWIPILNIYLLYKIGFKDSKIKWAILAILLTGSGTFALPMSLQIVIELLLVVLMLISLYNIFSKKSDKALYMIIACIVASFIGYLNGLSLSGVLSSFGVLGPFLLISVKNK